MNVHTLLGQIDQSHVQRYNTEKRLLNIYISNMLGIGIRDQINSTTMKVDLNHGQQQEVSTALRARYYAKKIVKMSSKYLILHSCFHVDINVWFSYILQPDFGGFIWHFAGW